MHSSVVCQTYDRDVEGILKTSQMVFLRAIDFKIISLMSVSFVKQLSIFKFMFRRVEKSS